MPAFGPLIAGFLLLNNVQAMYFFLKEGSEKCFVRELPDSTLLIGHYRCKAVSSKSEKVGNSNTWNATMLVEVKNPHRKTVLSREYKYEGRFSFTSHEPGEHTICMHSKVASSKMMKVDFDMQVGEHTINYTAVAKKEKLTEMETKFKELNEKASDIVKDLDYLRYREELFRESTEAISRRVLLWSIGQTIILIIMSMWQVYNLQLFFESKKLV
ncbi:hypothetical protein JTE90_008731 [Oedothorax gibbosus]|uniref:GOLD domain-containing protein n=1 Tax=Oedothorax gibbosus TaxID=931172 RepID=A0AAV6UPK7_9ARAC|nr:hypothetical protein JTE90_008731 [Oedothorax gibbosus]